MLLNNTSPGLLRHLASSVLAISALLLLASCAGEEKSYEQRLEDAKDAKSLVSEQVTHVLATASVPNDADDPAIWFNRADPNNSLILGTDKAAENGGIYVFNLDGHIVQSIEGIDRPNNIDVEYDFQLGERKVDIAVATERLQQRLKIFAISPNGELEDVTGDTRVFRTRSGDEAAPMGVGIYRTGEGEFYAIVSAKSGPDGEYLEQHKLVVNNGKVDTVHVRSFGQFSGGKEIEAVCVDNRTGIVYYADEDYGLRAYYADPDNPFGNEEIALFGLEHYEGDREGLTTYIRGGVPYLLSSDQIEGGSRIFVYNIPHARPPILMRIVPIDADDTDGIAATHEDLGPRFPYGILVAMNSKDKNFLIYDMRDIQRHLP